MSVAHARVLLCLSLGIYAPVVPGQTADFAKENYDKAKAAFQASQWEEAEKGFSKVLQFTKDPSLLLNSLYFRGYAQYKQGTCVPATSDLERMLELNPAGENAQQVKLAKEVVASCAKEVAAKRTVDEYLTQNRLRARDPSSVEPGFQWLLSFPKATSGLRIDKYFSSFATAAPNTIECFDTGCWAISDTGGEYLEISYSGSVSEHPAPLQKYLKNVSIKTATLLADGAAVVSVLKDERQDPKDGEWTNKVVAASLGADGKTTWELQYDLGGYHLLRAAPELLKDGVTIIPVNFVRATTRQDVELWDGHVLYVDRTGKLLSDRKLRGEIVGLSVLPGGEGTIVACEESLSEDRSADCTHNRVTLFTLDSKGQQTGRVEFSDSATPTVCPQPDGSIALISRTGYGCDERAERGQAVIVTRDLRKVKTLGWEAGTWGLCQESGEFLDSPSRKDSLGEKEGHWLCLRNTSVERGVLWSRCFGAYGTEYALPLVRETPDHALLVILETRDGTYIGKADVNEGTKGQP